MKKENFILLVITTNIFIIKNGNPIPKFDKFFGPRKNPKFKLQIRIVDFISFVAFI